MIYKSICFALLALCICKSAVAQDSEVTAMATREIGEHERVILFKKSVNPQNLMAVYTKVNADCSFKDEPGQVGHPVFDFYWLMNGSSYKRVASAIKNEIHNRLEASPSRNPNLFTVAVNDLKEVTTDIPEKDWKIDVTSAKGSKGCTVKAFMNLGPANKNARIQVRQIYSDASANILTRSVHIRSITLSGVNVKTGEEVSATYQGH